MIFNSDYSKVLIGKRSIEPFIGGDALIGSYVAQADILTILKNGGSFEYRGVRATYVAKIQTCTLGFFFTRTAPRPREAGASQKRLSLQFRS